MKMHYPAVIATALFFFVCIKNASSQNIGETTFKQTCAACHTIGKGRLVGPDLANADQRLSEDWIIKFVKSSRSVIESGDEYADSLFRAFNQVAMPDQPTLTDEQIREIIAYIKENSSASATTTSVAANVPGNIQRGQDLFVGNIRFANNGPACNSCHNVTMKGFTSGGALAKDLTQAVTRLSADGVKGIITGMPFPQMKQSYNNKALTEQEINDITAFLKQADEIAETQAASNIGKSMLWGGIAGAVVLLILFSFFWIKRKQRTVNYSIYKRQIKSA